jgi:hypothetical protein
VYIVTSGQQQFQRYEVGQIIDVNSSIQPVEQPQENDQHMSQRWCCCHGSCRYAQPLLAANSKQQHTMPKLPMTSQQQEGAGQHYKSATTIDSPCFIA